jgi:hypothetical protein
MNRKVSNGRTIALDIVKTRKKGDFPSFTAHKSDTDLYCRMGSESLLLSPEALLTTTGAGIMNGSGQSIPRGSFLCIYSGEVLTWKVAEYVLLSLSDALALTIFPVYGADRMRKCQTPGLIFSISIPASCPTSKISKTSKRRA